MKLSVGSFRLPGWPRREPRPAETNHKRAGLACTRRRIWRRWPATLVAGAFLSAGFLDAIAQSPTTLSGRTIELAVSTGTFPFGNNGAFRFLPSATDDLYAIVPIYGALVASTGRYDYIKTGPTTAQLSLTDLVSGSSTATCVFTTASSGTYILTSSSFPGGSQTGTFQVYSGPSPASIAGNVITITVTSGAAPFASEGVYQFLPASSGNTYSRIGLVNVGNAFGTYSYIQNSDTTCLVSFSDSTVGSGFTMQCSFDSPTSGTVFLLNPQLNGYQTGTFLLSKQSAVAPSISTQPQSQTATVGTSVAFSVIASGSPTPQYQWRKDGTNISGATSSSYFVSTVHASDAGAYSVLVFNSAGSINSSIAQLTVISPPSIIQSPASQTVAIGATAMFTVVAGGSTPLRYQWLKDGRPISSATSTSLTLNAVQANDAGNYSVVVSNAAGSTTSASAVLTVKVPIIAPQIVTQPKSQAVATGANATLAVTATGTAPLSYQWFKNGIAIAGAINATLAINDIRTSDAGNYAVAVSNAAGSATSANAVLTVQPPPVPPSVTAQPQRLTVFVGGSATFSITCTGTSPLTYQWLKDNRLLTGAGSPLLTISNVQLSDAGNYVVVVSNVAGSVTSAAAVLVVMPAVLPAITVQPRGQTVTAGEFVSLNVTASGSQPLSYAWFKDGQPIFGDSGAILELRNTQPQDSGNYSVVVSNAGGSVVSSNAHLVVQSLDSGIYISRQPAGQAVNRGSTVTFSVVASGALSYQWLFNGDLIPGATSAILILTNVQLAQMGYYSVLMKNQIGQLISDEAVLQCNWLLIVKATRGGSVSSVQASYAPNSYATVTAFPVVGFLFSGWNGDETGTNTQLSILMDRDKTVTAIFAVPAPHLSFIRPSSGTSWVLHFSATVGEYYRIDVSADLRSWTLISVLRATASGTEYPVMIGDNHGFYRVFWQP